MHKSVLFVFIAEDIIEKLETELAQANDLAKRYRDRYVQEKMHTPRHSSAATVHAPPPPPPPVSEPGEDKPAKVTEDDLDDDEAIFKRHVARLAETKSMGTTTPIRIQDIIRKNEVCSQ